MTLDSGTINEYCRVKRQLIQEVEEKLVILNSELVGLQSLCPHKYKSDSGKFCSTCWKEFDVNTRPSV